jgi:hypothetical protein
MIDGVEAEIGARLHHSSQFARSTDMLMKHPQGAEEIV